MLYIIYINVCCQYIGRVNIKCVLFIYKDSLENEIMEWWLKWLKNLSTLSLVEHDKGLSTSPKNTWWYEIGVKEFVHDRYNEKNTNKGGNVKKKKTHLSMKYSWCQRLESIHLIILL